MSSIPASDLGNPAPAKRVLWKWSAAATVLILAFLMWQCGSALLQGRKLADVAVRAGGPGISKAWWVPHVRVLLLDVNVGLPLAFTQSLFNYNLPIINYQSYRYFSVNRVNSNLRVFLSPSIGASLAKPPISGIIF